MTSSDAPAAADGLSTEEAARRLEAGRGNRFAAGSSRSFRRIVNDNAVTPVNLVLFFISGVLIALGLFADAVLTGGLVLGNIAVGVFQETRAKRQLDRIALLNRPQAAVIRDGSEHQLAPDEVVEGDLLVLRPGDQVLVDGPVITSQGLGVDESLLTGEADTVLKRPGDQLVSGSFCVTGAGVFEAGRVGSATVANQITARARADRVPRTPLQREVGLVIWAMSLVVIFLGAQVARSANAAPGDVSLTEAVRAAAVIVALVPQGLAVMVTVSYAMAAVRLVGTGVLVQRMNAVESISHVDMLCIDKTGTITTNRLTLEALAPLELDRATLTRILGDFAASVTSSNRTLDGVRAAFPGTPRPVRREVPFDSARKWSALLLDTPQPRGWLVFGAPEVLAPRCADATSLAAEAEVWARQGLRVLLFAEGGDTDPAADAPEHALPERLTPLGLVVLRDETRPDAGRVAAEFQAAGIDLKIISGDHPETVAALALQAGIKVKGAPVSGAELDRLSESELQRVALGATIFGRVSPQTKEALVRTLQHGGHYVAMIGDGVNDVPALKAAQVAVAMRSGSGITRSIADLVLLRDEFSQLPAAFREGQRIRKGMEGIFRLFLTRTLSLSLIVLAVSLLNDPFPVTPKHTALIALLTVGIPALAVAAWAQPGKTRRLILLSGGEFVLPAALGIAAVALVIYELFLSTTGDVALARSALTLTSVLCGLLLILFLEPPTPAWTGASPLSGDWRPTLLGGVMLVAFIVALVIPDLRRFYELKLPDVWGLLTIVLVVIAWATALRFVWRLEPTAWLRRLSRRVASWRARRRLG